MKKYLNHSGKSGVLGYETGTDYIRVWFLDGGKSYLYNQVRPGKIKVEKMKKLAAAGEGLSTYISQEVREDY